MSRDGTGSHKAEGLLDYCEGFAYTLAATRSCRRVPADHAASRQGYRLAAVQPDTVLLAPPAFTRALTHLTAVVLKEAEERVEMYG